MKGLNAYQRIGMSTAWLDEFLADPEAWPTENSLSVSQFEAMTAWLAHAGVMDRHTYEMTPLGECLAKLGVTSPLTWCVIWAELVERSSLIGLYVREMPVEATRSRGQLLDMLTVGIQPRTAENALVSLAGTLGRTTLGSDLEFGIVGRNGSACVEITRKRGQGVPAEAVLYALYRRAKSAARYAASLREIMADPTGGPARLYGLDGDTIEGVLRGLSSRLPQLVRTEFAHGLDYVLLNESIDPDAALSAMMGVRTYGSNR